MKRIILLAGLMLVISGEVGYGQGGINATKITAEPKKEEVPDYIKEYEEGFVSQEKFFNASNNMMKIGKPAIPHLINFAKDKTKNMWLRERALELIGTINDASAADSLIEILNDKDQDVAIRSEAIETLQQINAVQAAPYLLNALNDESPTIRGTAAWTLGYLKCEKSVTNLIKIVQNENEIESVRSDAIISLGNLEDKMATDTLISILSKPNFRRYSILALAKIKDPNAIDILIKIALDRDNEDRYAAIGALGKIGDKRAIEPLLKILNEGNSYSAMEASKALADIGDIQVAEAIKEQIDRADTEFSKQEMKKAYKKLTGKDYKGDK